jgi:hypothetical protein
VGSARALTFALLLLMLPLLQEAARISAPGSIFAGNFLTAAGLALLHSRSASTAAAASATAGTTTSQPDNTPAAATTASNSEPASNTSAAVNSSRVRPFSLMSQFKWGCPDNVEQVGASFRTVLPIDWLILHVVGPLKLPLSIM